MHRLILGNTGVITSHLGFGCVQLTAHKDRGDAIRILEHAFASGITHFDVSRIYGFGRAEGILGEFLRGKRHQVTVATKFGIQPPTGLAGNRRVIDFAKKVRGPFPNLLRRARQRGSTLVQSGVFTPQNAVHSLESSLRELGTEAVDIFLLHEATLADASNPALLEALQRQVDRGTVRSHGVASSFRHLQIGAIPVPSVYKILQFEHNAENRNLGKLVQAQELGVVPTASSSRWLPCERLRWLNRQSPKNTQPASISTSKTPPRWQICCCNLRYATIPMELSYFPPPIRNVSFPMFTQPNPALTITNKWQGFSSSWTRYFHQFPPPQRHDQRPDDARRST